MKTLTDNELVALLDRARKIVLAANISENPILQSAALSDVFERLTQQADDDRAC